jgi:hypothetical protein
MNLPCWNITRKKVGGIYYIDVYKGTFNLYFIPQKLLLHEFMGQKIRFKRVLYLNRGNGAC